MHFSSLLFIYIYLPVLILFYFIIKDNAWRRGLLILFSLVFYAWGEPVYVLLMLICVLVNYIFGLGIGRAKSDDKIKRSFILMFSAVVVNLGFLIFLNTRALLCRL